MKRIFAINDSSWVVACLGDGKLETVGNISDRRFEILGEDCILPSTRFLGKDRRCDTVIRDLRSGNIYFAVKRLMVRTNPEKTIKVDGKEYSESTIKQALREYVG